MKADEIKNIPVEKFQFAKDHDYKHDKKLDTKPIGYFQDAWNRFSRNKGSVVAAIILLGLFLYAIIVPIVSRYDINFIDTYYTYALPKNNFFAKFGIWDGTSTMKGVNQATYDYYNAIPGALVEVKAEHETVVAGKTTTVYDIVVDSYYKVGWAEVYLTESELDAALAYEEETGVQLFYPLLDTSKIACKTYQSNQNAWFLTNAKGAAKYDANGDYENIYLTENSEAQGKYTSEDGYKYVQSKMNGTQYQTRVLYYEWYKYKHDGVEPEFYFGIDAYGKDIFTCLGVGARVSFMIGISVSIINFLLGTIYGAIEGYYGGKIDLIMERIAEILYDMPFIVVAVLFQMYFARSVGAIGALLFAYVTTGWIGTASTVRMQFYRFKGQEYVLAARTLGANDRRLMFKHIFPNALGTIVTRAVLMIPSAIFTESFLSYLGLINLSTSGLTSIGTLLSNGQASLSTYPHCIAFPAIFISLMMICFNMFGNGLRDAFNPSLRGSEG